MTDRGKAPKTKERGAVSAPRRKFLATAALGTAAAALLWSSRPAAAKTSKSAAKYQDSPHGKQHCSKCYYFQPPHECKLVAGDISPNGWCRFFRPKG